MQRITTAQLCRAYSLVIDNDAYALYDLHHSYKLTERGAEVLIEAIYDEKKFLARCRAAVKKAQDDYNARMSK